MPTYVCSVPPEKLSSSQKLEIAKSISNRHSEATGAPPFFVQVVIEETEHDRYLGGQKTSDHVWVRGDIRAGRTEAAREQMMLNIMEDISRITQISHEHIWVYVCNLALTDMVEYGHVLPLPGKEKEWFENLPVSLQRYLNSLGTTKDNFTL
jgi:phenylpyruvate tautomerase PptA (4-oxalocrotonate tautomerase family)